MHGLDMQLHQKILGIPFVYNTVRPFVVGGIDMGPVYGRLALEPSDTVLDIGCGTGDALNYLAQFEKYLGVDTDPVAIESARTRYASRANATFECKIVGERDVAELAPTVVTLAGLLHHLDDATAISVLKLAASSPRIRRVVTQDIVYLPGAEHWVSNAFAALDRGRFCRRPQGYRDLIARAGLKLVSDDLIWSNPERHRAKYFVTTLVG